MKLLSVLKKSMREQVRDFWTLSLTLSLGPFFVFFYWLMLGGRSTTYDLLVINHDAGVQVNGAAWNAGDDLIDALDDLTYSTGDPMMLVKQVTDRNKAEKSLKDRNGDLLLEIPSNFSQALVARAANAGHTPPVEVQVVGDKTNPYYSIASVIMSGALDRYLRGINTEASPVAFSEQALGDSGARTEFETWVPGLFIMAAVMLIYEAAMTIAREIEGGTISRLQITRMTAVDLLGGISLSQILIGVVAVILTFLSAVVMGFHSEGPLWIAVLLGGITSMAMVGVGLIVACFSRTVSRAFMISNFPLFLMTFFSGVFMPIPSLKMITISGHSLGLLDILPPSQAVVALNKVVSLGAGLDDILFELSVLIVLSIIYFAVGVWMFQKMYLRRA